MRIKTWDRRKNGNFGFMPPKHHVILTNAAVASFLWGNPCTARYFETMFPPKSPQARPLETPLELGDPNWTGGDLEGDLPGSCGSGEGPGAFGGKLTVCWAVEMEGSEVANLNLGWQRRWTPSCIADSPLSTHLGSIPSGGVCLQQSQPPWQEVAGHVYRTPYPQY